MTKAVETLFGSDPTIQAVGIGRHEGAFGYKAVRNAAKITPQAGVVGLKAAAKAARIPKSIRKIPVTVETVSMPISHHGSITMPLDASFLPEQQMNRPLACGLQIQNVDNDSRLRRTGALSPQNITVGTIGCFVTMDDGFFGLISNNHVIAGENQGVKGQDRILQSGALNFSSSQHVATLSDFVALVPSQQNPANGGAANDVDAGVAKLLPGVDFSQEYLDSRDVVAPTGKTLPQVGDRVMKIGRTTGLTRGTIVSVSTVLGPIGYSFGPCWFQNAFEVQGDNGTLFSDHGDSGSLIISTTGEVIGLLFSGNGTSTFANPIDPILAALNCSLVP